MSLFDFSRRFFEGELRKKKKKKQKFFVTSGFILFRTSSG